MKQKLLIALLVFAFNNLIAQNDSIPVGSNSGAGSIPNSSNPYGPLMSNTSGALWNRHAYIYPSSLYTTLKSGTALNGVGFPRFTASGTFGSLTGTVSLRIYLKNTTATDFGAGNADWNTESTGATLVYNGTSADIMSIVGNTYGLKKFPFTTNFVYTGGNIEMLVEYTQSSASSGDVSWMYDKTTNIPAYASNQVKYATGAGNTPSTTTLSTSASAHPAMLLYFKGAGCTGVPTAGNIPFLINACQGSYTALNVNGFTADLGIHLQWQQSNSGSGPWTNVVGGSTDTLSYYITPNLYNTTYYRVKVTCGYTLDSAFTNTDTINITHQPSMLPLLMGFNSTTPQVECLSQDVVVDTQLTSQLAPSISLLSSLGNPTNTPAATIYAQEGNRMVKFNSADCDPYDAIRFKMPELNTKGLSGVDMYYFYYQINGYKASTDNIAIQYSLDNKVWVTVSGSLVNITNTAQDSTHNGWQKVFLSLPSAVANKDSVWVAFLLTSGYGYNILLDNVKLGATGTLPVKYIDVKATKAGANNRLTWTTFEEKDNNYFEVERSANAKEFVSIGKLNTKAINGNSTSELTYSFIDNNTLLGNNYYRIKQTDKNGAIYYSEVVLVKQDKVNTLNINRVYPNPSMNGKISITVYVPESTALTISITDVAGKVIKQYTQNVLMGDNDININLTGVEKGNYFIRTATSQLQSNALMFEKR